MNSDTAAGPTGSPWTPHSPTPPLARRFPNFVAEPTDLHRAAAKFDWPMVLLSGSRDLRTPPAIAERVAAAAPDATLVRITNGHSALESHPEALLVAASALASGSHDLLPSRENDLDRLPRRGLAARVPDLLAALVRLGQISPGRLPPNW